VTRLRVGRPGFESRQGQEFGVQTSSGTLPSSYPAGTAVFSSGIKPPGREADHSPPSSDQVKIAWGHTSILPCVFMARCLVKDRDNFTFCLTDLMQSVGGNRAQNGSLNVRRSVVTSWIFLYAPGRQTSEAAT